MKPDFPVSRIRQELSVFAGCAEKGSPLFVSFGMKRQYYRLRRKQAVLYNTFFKNGWYSPFNPTGFAFRTKSVSSILSRASSIPKPLPERIRR